MNSGFINNVNDIEKAEEESRKNHSICYKNWIELRYQMLNVDNRLCLYFDAGK